MNRFLLTLVMTFAVFLAAGLWIPLKAALAQELLTLAWAESQARQIQTRPWPWADTWPVARLQLPGTGQPLIVLAGAHGESLAFGPAHVTGTSVPGKGGPVVIAGHRDTHFRVLQNLALDSTIRLQDRHGEWTDYRVTGLKVADSRKGGLDLSRLPEDSLVLVTCYPFNSVDNNGPLRFLVEARRARGTDQAADHKTS